MIATRTLRLSAHIGALALVVTSWCATPGAVAAGPTPTCAGHTATIVSRGDEASTTGTSTDDVIVALGRNSTVDAGDGNDVVCLVNGGSARGGAGDDLIIGSRSDDELSGGDGNDVLRARSGEDRLSGGAGDDRLFGGPAIGCDYFSADPGDDLWVERPAVGSQADDLRCASRFDFSSSTAGVHVDLSGPIVLGVGHGTAEGDAIGHDRLRFSAVGRGFVAPRLLGTPNDDKLIGSKGRDYIDGFLGADVIWGLPGDDTLGECCGYALPEGSAPPMAPGISFMWGGPGDDQIQSDGNTRQAVLHGGDGNDRIDFIQESAHVTGDDGDDRILGTGEVSPDKDVAVAGGAGTDSGQFTLGSSGRQTAYGTVTVDLDAGTLTTSAGDSLPFTGLENFGLWFESASDPAHLVDSIVLRGTAAANDLGVHVHGDRQASVYGLAGDDILTGGDGDDHLDGGAGNDAGDGMGGHNTCVDVETATNCS